MHGMFLSRCALRPTLLNTVRSNILTQSHPTIANMSTSTSTATTTSAMVDLAQQMQSVLETELAPLSHCEIINESFMHSVPKGSQTHFKLFLVSEKFQGVMPVQRHRLVYAWTKPFMRPADASPSDADFFHRIHALSIVAKTPQEWEREKDTISKRSPACLGGEKRAAAQEQEK